MTSPEVHVSRGEAAQAISNALVRLLRDDTGRGPTQAYTTITDSHVVVVLRDALLLKAERSLVKDGHGDAVIAVEVLILKPRGSIDDRDLALGSADGDGSDGASAA